MGTVDGRHRRRPRESFKVDSNSLQFIGLEAEVFVMTFRTAYYNRCASVCGILTMCGTENSITGKPEDRLEREVGFGVQGYIEFMHIAKCL